EVAAEMAGLTARETRTGLPITMQFSPPAGEAGDVAFPQVPGYEFLGLLGRGGMGEVYRAREVLLDRIVALKVVRGRADTEALIRFRREAELLANLNHRNIAKVLRFDQAGGLLWFTMEFYEGGSLDARLRSGPLPPAEAAALVEQISRGIHHAHDAGIVHRDLKPHNVLLDAQGTPKVGDFGLAREVG